MKRPTFVKMLAFLERLEQAKISHTMQHSREDAIMVTAFAPGQYWEIEFLEDGAIEIERFRSDGHIDDESILPELFALCSDVEPAAIAVKQNASITRK